MDKMTRVAVDAMGGDNAPLEIVKGVVEAVNENSNIKVYLTGREEAIRQELARYTFNKEQVEVVNATEVIETAEPPVMAIRKKKDSSIVVALNLVKKRGVRCLCLSGKLRCGSCRRTVDCRQNQRNRASASRAADSDGDRLCPPDRLRSQCGCASIASGSVCQDGFCVHGERHGNLQSKGCDCQYRGGGGERECACEGDVSYAQELSGDQLYREH